MASPPRSRRAKTRRGPAGTGRRLRILAARWVMTVGRRPVPVLAAAAVLAVASLVYAALSLEISTSNRDLIDEDVPYRQNQAAYVDAFPQFDDIILTVIEGETPEITDAASERVLAELEEREEAFATIYAPGAEPFFQRNGLLYLDLAELETLADRIARIQPFLVRLAQDPSLPTLFGLLAGAGEAIEQGALAPGDLVPVTTRVAEAIDDSLAGGGAPLSWRSMLAGGEVDLLERRQFILVQPLPAATADAAETPPVRRLALDAVREAVEAALVPPLGEQTTVRLTGAPVLAEAELQTVREGAMLAGVLSFAAVTVLLVIGLGSIRSVLAVVLTLVIGLAWTIGYTTLVLGRLNLISVTFIVLFVGLAVDFGIHFVMRWREARMRIRSPVRVLGNTARMVAWALTLSACGSALGFFSFIPTDYTGLAELGIIAGGSMFVALIVFLTVLPALVRVLPSRYGLSRAEMRKRRREPRLLLWLARQSRWPVIAGVAALAAFAVGLASQVQFDANPLNLQDPETEAALTLADLKQDVRTTPDTANAVAPSLEQANDLAARLEALAGVAQTITLSNFVPRNQEDKLFLIDTLALSLWPAFTGEEAPAPPDDAARAESVAALLTELRALEAGDSAVEDEAYRAAAAELAGALERLQAAARTDPSVLATAEADLIGTLPRLLQRLERLLSPDQEIALETLPEQLRSRWITDDGRARIEIRPALALDDAAAMQQFSEAVLAVAPQATGGPIIIEGGADVVTRAFVTATLLTTVLVVALLVLVRLSWACMGLILVPLMLAAALTLASAVVLGQPLNFANIIALPLVFGLGVSSSIHLVMRWDQAGRDLAVLNTSTPQAVLLSALTTAASFGTLALSPHPGTASMGLLLSVALLQVLFCTLVVLPALLSLASPRRPAAPA